MGEEQGWIPTRFVTIDKTRGTVDPLTASHTAEMDSLGKKYDEVKSTLADIETQYAAQTKTLSENLLTRSQTATDAVELVENNFNLILLGLIFYYLLFKG